ncbi:hypothetical protein TD95_002201 [Thielaviopsis punctulata]|uniref:Ribonucleases P/MRP subunit Pop8-like domain-containing protein n=1 Tax=Thielaviopsis punctulata TaxID=72032 RepID=A0A0F4ZG08_9PEZI|nr:hypothetical protein TD95_002201 [Thielaviopsis punctulata]
MESIAAPAPSKLPPIIQTFTIRAPDYAYAHLELVSTSSPASSCPSAPDALQVRSLLSHALSRFLGAVGNAVHPDILRVTADGHAWVRVPRDDLPVLTAALAFWSGERDGAADVTLRVRRAGNWLGCLVGQDAEEEKLWG